MKKLTKFVAALTVAAGLFSAGSAQAAGGTFLTIGTGGATGVYFPAGGAICRLMNKARKQHHIRCTVESTGGSIYNLNALRGGDLEMGVAQSDWQYHAYKGTAKFKKAGAFTKLRSVFSLHPEPFTVVARADSGVTKFEDLKGKRVNIGNPGSGQRATMDVLMKAYGWTGKTFAFASELKAAEQTTALCDNKVDAIVMAVGHPSGAIVEATSTCKTVLVSVEGPVVEKLIKENSYYGPATIPGGMYTGNPQDTKTFGVAATMVTTADVSDTMVYELVKAVFTHFNAFKKQHPAFGVLTKEAMVQNNNSAPLHPGAVKYYKEAGLLK